MPNVKTYDPKKVMVIFGPVVLTGFAEDTFIILKQMAMAQRLLLDVIRKSLEVLILAASSKRLHFLCCNQVIAMMN